MKQSKKGSFIEALTNTAAGFIISYAATFLIFPIVNIDSNPSKNFVVTVFFTLVSLLRGYLIRRFFNGK